MDIPNLQAFIAVAECQSFSQAADRLHLTQPAVSKRISTLETDLKVRLFDRIGRRVNPTEAGAALLPRARKILLEIEDSKRALSLLNDEVTGLLSIGTSHHIGLHRLPPVLQNFCFSYGRVRLDLHFMDSEIACEAVEQGELELGIITLPDETPNRLKSIKIWNDPLQIVTGPTHPLRDCRQVNPSQLVEHTAVLPSTGTYTRRTVERTFNDLGFDLSVDISTNYLETLRMMVDIGLGWSVLPETMIDKSLNTHRVQGLVLQRALGIVFHRERTLSRAAVAMLDLLLASSDYKDLSK